VARLRARARRKGEGNNMLARVLDWHERSTKDLIKKNEASVASMDRALEILKGYSFVDETPPAQDEVSSALYDTIQALDELAAILNAQPKAAVG
jgi:5-bromo-4-chloroindolyl phosphate hydrolysis protein